MTVHYVEHFVLKSYLLALKHISNKHTSENLIEELTGILEKWEILKKVVAVSADGAANIKKVNR